MKVTNSILPENLDVKSCVLESFKTVTKMFKHLDIVVNCAGILDGKNWEKEMVTNIVSISV